jgi:branched-chain amino acid transport system substrate-binding protein
MASKITRRTFVAGAATAAGSAVFMGPWKHNRVWASTANKPIRIGLTHDASGQFANSGQAEKRGTIMAIEEVNEAGGLMGRKLEYLWMDTETTPQTGTRVA